MIKMNRPGSVGTSVSVMVSQDHHKRKRTTFIIL